MYLYGLIGRRLSISLAIFPHVYIRVYVHNQLYIWPGSARICTEIPSFIHWTVPHARIHDGSAAHMHPPLRNTRPASRSSSCILVDMAGRCDLGRVLADGSSQLVVYMDTRTTLACMQVEVAELCLSLSPCLYYSPMGVHGWIG